VTDPRAAYQARLDACRQRVAALEATHLRISNGRLVVALLGAILLWFAVGRGWSGLWPIAAGLMFFALVVWHARLLQRLERAQRAAGWYARGLSRIAGEWAGERRDGAQFLKAHAYGRDLDLFGHASLFQLLNTANTEIGEETLAAWLKTAAPIAEVNARQVAVAELRGKTEFREDLAVLAAETEVSRTGSMAAWASAAPAGLTAAVAVVFAACAAVTIVVLALTFAEKIPSRYFIFWLIAEAAIAAIWRKPVHQVLARIGSADRDLSLVRDALARIESETVQSPRLMAIKTALFTEGMPPSRRIDELRRLVSWLDSSRNQMFAPIAFAILLPQQLAVAIDRWHARYGRRVVDWLTAIGELEALAALATYSFEHPHDPFPLVCEAGPRFDASGLAHPLMREDTSVRNDVSLGGPGERILVISGSNMSGKSTLLRSVGVNVVLALAGAPVRATQLTLSPLALGATLKVEDSLEEGHSRFYAEILRIKSIVDTARGSMPLLFLLDEILHGTNSHDRRIGAEAIVKALAEAGAIGLVTTHDLALTELPSRLGAVAVNKHFEDRLVDGKMVFDYRMRPGVVEHSNALALMRAVGLDV
jgi:MutS domain V